MAYDVNIHPGMEVYGSDGGQIGRITDVHPAGFDPEGGEPVVVEDNAPDYGGEGFPGSAQPLDPMLTGSAPSAANPAYYGTEPERERPGTTPALILDVQAGGHFGFGGKHLSIPSDAVVEVIPHDRVVLDCDAARANDLYGDGDGDDSSGGVIG